MTDLIATNWPHYELLDTGNRLRLERFADRTVVRPDNNILWQPSDPHNNGWQKPDFRFDPELPTRWQGNEGLQKEGWLLNYQKATFRVRPTAFRHMGLFPEQLPQWNILTDLVKQSEKKVKVLNLFAYTGAASVLLAQAGATVCHVDASKGSLMWAKENARLSGLPEDVIRWIVDDVPKFLQREVHRGNHYDLILIDPPVFGRGPQGEIWRLEEQLAELASLTTQLFSEKPLGFFLNFYATALYPESVKRTFDAALPGKLILSSVGIEETVSKKILQTGFCLHS